MEDEQKEQLTQRNSSLSVVLILLNVLLMLLFFYVVPSSEDDRIGAFLISMLLFVLLMGLYIFSYRGKNYRLAKWIFGIALLATLILFGLLWYAVQLGKAFQH